MDPLSIIANLIAVANAAGATTRGLERIANIRHAPQQVLRLINEISDFRSVLVTTQETLKQFHSIGNCETELLQSLVQTGSNTLQEIDDIIHSTLIRSDGTISSKPQWKLWLKKYGALEKVGCSIRRTRVDMTSTLTLLTATQLPHIHISLENILLSQQQMQRTNESMALEIARIRPSVDSIQGLLQRVLTSSQTLELSNANTKLRSSQNPTFRFQTSIKPSCSQFCICRCHQVKKASSPTWMAGLLGLLFASYSGLPILRNTPCNETQCKQNQKSLLRVNYYFPSWLLNRMVIFRDQWSPYDGHIISVRTPRLISRHSEIFVMIQMGNLDGIRNLFASGAASPFDTQEDDGRSVLMHAVTMKQAEVAALLLDEYADPTQTDKDSVTPIDQIWTYIFRSPKNPTTEKFKSSFKKFLDPEESLQNKGFTLLHRIVLGLSKMDLKAYLEYSTSEINCKCFKGWTPLFWATSMSDVKAIETLLEFGADPLIRGPLQKTIFDRIAQDCDDNSPVLNMIINATPKHLLKETMNGIDDHGHPAMSFAILFNKSNQVNTLLANGATTDDAASGMISPLLIAIQFNRHNIITLLLGHGASTRPDDFLPQIAGYGDLETMQILIAAGICCLDTGKKDEFFQTPLQQFEEKRPLYATESKDDREKLKTAFLEFLESIRWPDFEHVCSNNYALGLSNLVESEERDSISSDDEDLFFDALSADGGDDKRYSLGFVIEDENEVTVDFGDSGELDDVKF